MKLFFKALVRMLTRDYIAFDIQINVIKQNLRTLRKEFREFWYVVDRVIPLTEEELEQSYEYTLTLITRLEEHCKTYLEHHDKHLRPFELYLNQELYHQRAIAKSGIEEAELSLAKLKEMYEGIIRVRSVLSQEEDSNAIGTDTTL